MGGYGADVAERGAGAPDEVMLDGEDGFGSDGERAFQKEIVDADDGAGECVFDGGEESVGAAFADGAENGVEGGAGDGGDGFAEELDGGFFAEGAGLALEGDAQSCVAWRVVWRSHALGSLFATAKFAASRVGHRKGASCREKPRPMMK